MITFLRIRDDGTHHTNDGYLSILLAFAYSIIFTWSASFISLRVMYEVSPVSYFTLSYHPLVVITILLITFILLQFPLSVSIASSVCLFPMISYNILQLYPSTSTWLYRLSALSFSVDSAICPSGVLTYYTAILRIVLSFDVPKILPIVFLFLFLNMSQYFRIFFISW